MLVLLYSSVYKIVVWQINRHMAIKVIFNIRILPLFLKFIIFPFLQHEDEYNIHPCGSLQRSIASLIINTDPDRQQVDTGPGGSVNNCINNITPDHACQYCHCHFCAISGHWVTKVTNIEWVELLLTIHCIYLLSDCTHSAHPAV